MGCLTPGFQLPRLHPGKGEYLDSRQESALQPRPASHAAQNIAPTALREEFLLAHKFRCTARSLESTPFLPLNCAFRYCGLILAPFRILLALPRVF
jgi:hypothetical protein